MKSTKEKRQTEALRFFAITGIAIAGFQLLIVVSHDITKSFNLYNEVAALAPVAQASIVECRTPIGNLFADEEFVQKAAEAGMTEVALGKLGSDKASSKEVKDFAKMMVKDHTKANDALKALAKKKGIDVPSECKMCPEKTQQLGALNGKDFDQKFMEIMLADHKEAVNLFSMESQQGQDQDLKTWAGQTLPTLEHHLMMAEKIKL